MTGRLRGVGVEDTVQEPEVQDNIFSHRYFSARNKAKHIEMNKAEVKQGRVFVCVSELY